MSFEPHVFGHYYLLEHLAVGGMAEVYRAKSFGASGFERELALKRVLSKLTENPDFLTMLVNEAKLTATLHHGNVAQVFDLGVEDGVYFMSMEYVEGVSLKQILKTLAAAGEVLTPHEAAYLAFQVCQGLDYAHRKTDPMGKPLGIVHCDVSPGNVIVGFDGTAKVVDFGIARAQASFSNYKEGMVMGKFNYVAPEQALDRSVDRRADVFSTGIVLYELLTGVHPFGKKGDVDTLVRIARSSTGDVKPPDQLRPEIPPELSQAVMAALASDRDARMLSSAHLAEALRQWMHPTAPSEVHQRVAERIQTTFGDLIRTRRDIRARDEETVRALRRHLAEAARGDAPGGPRPAMGGAMPVPVAVRRPSGRRWVWPVAVVAAAAVAFLAGWKAMAPAPSATLFVSSQPQGAALAVDHAARGRTPAVLEVVPGRPYLVELRAPGHDTFTRTFSASPGQVVRLTPALAARMASLEVTSTPPGARVSIDGQDRGPTPVTVRLPVATDANVRVRLGTISDAKLVHVAAGGNVVKFRFEGLPSRSRRHPSRHRTRRR